MHVYVWEEGRVCHVYTVHGEGIAKWGRPNLGRFLSRQTSLCVV